jgi:hypothetical protein
MPDRGRRPLRLAVLAAAVALLCGVAAWAAAGGFLLTGRPAHSRPVAPAIPTLGQYLAIAVVGVIVVGELMLLGWGFVVRRDPELMQAARVRTPAKGSGSLYFALVAVAVVILAHEGIFNRFHFLQGGAHGAGGHGQGSGSPGSPTRTISSPALGLLVTVALALILAGMVAAAVYMRRSGRGRGEEAESLLDQAIAADLAEGIEDLETIDDPREAVLTSYDRLERTLKAHGIPVRPADTPDETVTRVLSEHRGAGRSARRLADLFRQARFSPRPVDDRMRDSALRALRDLRARFGGNG